jgi:hypothetical protein
VSHCRPGEHWFTTKYIRGRIVFQDGSGQRWWPRVDSKITFGCDESFRVTSVIEREPDGNAGTRISLIPHFNVSTVTDLLQRVEDKLRGSFKAISTPPATAERHSQESQRPLLASQPSNPTSEAGRWKEEFVQGKGDGGTNDTQAATGPWGETDDGSGSE